MDISMFHQDLAMNSKNTDTIFRPCSSQTVIDITGLNSHVVFKPVIEILFYEDDCVCVSRGSESRLVLP